MIRPTARSRSKYERTYLTLNELRYRAGRKPLTPKSFLGAVLKGAARLHTSQYADALIARMMFSGACGGCSSSAIRARKTILLASANWYDGAMMKPATYHGEKTPVPGDAVLLLASPSMARFGLAELVIFRPHDESLPIRFCSYSEVTFDPPAPAAD